MLVVNEEGGKDEKMVTLSRRGKEHIRFAVSSSLRTYITTSSPYSYHFCED